MSEEETAMSIGLVDGNIPALQTRNKYVYLYVIQVFSGKGYGWEDLSAAEQTPKGFREVKEDIKLYRENQPGTYRLIKRRELNQE